MVVPAGSLNSKTCCDTDASRFQPFSLTLCTDGQQHVHNKRQQKKHSDCLQVMQCGEPGHGDVDGWWVESPKQQCDTDRELFHSHRIHAAYLPEHLKRHPTLDTCSF